jgi:UDP-GlcNAc:undecaprenyl-phosphate/decaprenyl-phosphate GlcNAc-1-phosphate transferase
VGGYAVVMAIAMGVTLVATPVVRFFVIRFGAVVEPRDARHVHTKPMPTLGGAAMLLGFLVAFAVASHLPQFHEVFQKNSEPFGVVLAAGVMFIVGALDDLRDVSPPAKVAGEVFAASLLALNGVTMFHVQVPFNLFGTDVWVPGAGYAPLITVLWVVLMTNAINLIDGLDGLAAGIVAIGGTALFLFADRLFHSGYLEGSNIGPLVCVVAVGVCLGFLPYNFNPARIIMGDAGALFLGLLLAVPTITVGGRTDVQYSGNTYFFFAPLVIPIVILGVPMADVVFSFLRRVLSRQRWSSADAGHLHHRLVRLGHGPRRAVVILWAWTALLSAVALWPTYTDSGNALVPFAIGGLALMLYILFHPGVRSARLERSRPRPPAESAPHLADGAADVVDFEAEAARRRRA